MHPNRRVPTRTSKKLRGASGGHGHVWLGSGRSAARWGIEMEARHREALHSALMTGVRHALARGLQEREVVAEAAVDYVRTSVPDALTALRPAPQQLIEMAAATFEAWRGHS